MSTQKQAGGHVNVKSTASNDSHMDQLKEHLKR